jgi:hypothetical protein
MDVRSMQRPLKDQYRRDPASSRITLRAHGRQTNAPISCSVDLGRAIYDAQAHKGVGGAGTSMGIPAEGIEVTVEGDLDLSGTLGLSKEVPVGFEGIRIHFAVNAPGATPEQLAGLREKSEQYCVVMQTLLHPPKIQSTWQ